MSARILIVLIEDEALIAMDLKRRLDAVGYRVDRIFSSGEDAVAFAVHNQLDLVLVDGRLAGEIDGIETMRRIRRTHATVPMIFVTGYTNESFIERAQELNPVACLTKPVDISALITHIDSVLQ